jgi:acyl carrier protein
MIPLTQVVASVLGVHAEEVTEETGPATNADWTSIKHLQLIIAVEENYSLSFSREEIRSVRTVGDLRRNLVSRGVAP